MAKLTHAELERGREFVRQHDLEGLTTWVRGTKVRIDIRVVRNTFRNCFIAGNTPSAVRIFDAAFKEADPTRDQIIWFMQIAILVFVVLGLFGGVSSLVRGCF